MKYKVGQDIKFDYKGAKIPGEIRFVGSNFLLVFSWELEIPNREVVVELSETKVENI